MITEIQTYPFEPGIRGIPFADLQVDQDNRPFISGSGSLLLGHRHQDDIYVTTTDDTAGKFHLSALVKERGIVSFDLKTKVIRNDVPTRHPDFFAAPFVQYAIDFFIQQGLPVHAILSKWATGSDNHRTFMEVFTRTRDKVTAARSTWGGKMYSKLGFTNVYENRVQLYNDGSRVEALFEKARNI